MFATVWMVEMIWDIRDLKGDRETGVKTIPAVLGISSARWGVGLINLLLALLLVAALYSGLLPSVWYLVLSNNLLIGLWVFWNRGKILTARMWSHLLLVLQVVLLIIVGMLATLQLKTM